MEWNTIEYIYPLAFKKFVNIMFPNTGILTVSSLDNYDIKKLYKFFDNEGIYLTVEMYNPRQWVFSISFGNGVVYGPAKESQKTRVECEISGFFESFRLLDKKLTDKS